jgi:hypothetical protein
MHSCRVLLLCPQFRLSDFEALALVGLTENGFMQVERSHRRSRSRVPGRHCGVVQRAAPSSNEVRKALRAHSYLVNANLQTELQMRTLGF